MARPNKPHWHEHSRRWKSKVRGKVIYFPREIGRYDKPQMDGVPRAAWDHLHALQRRAEGQATATTDPTIYWLVELYLAWCETERDQGRLSAGQYAGHCTHLGKFLGHVGPSGKVGDVRAARLDVDTVEDFFESMRGEGYSAHYLANLGKSVRAMLNWAARPVKGRVPGRILAANPLRDHKFPRAPGAVRGYVEGAVVRRFLRWAWARARAQRGLMRRFDRIYVLMLRFQRLTGCRPGEACRLEWGQIDWQARLITLAEHKTAKKTGKARKIHVTRPVLRLLRAIERLPGRHTVHVFTHRRVNGAIDRGQESAEAGEPWQGGSSASQKITDWRREAIAAGLPGIADLGPKKLVAYANRHAYASEAVSSGLSIEHTAELLGNTAAVTASTYSHSIDDAAARRAREFAERRGSAGK